MKKIFYIIASAIVALGAVACQNDIEEGIKGEGVSFYADVDNLSRIDIGDKVDGKGYPVIWEENDRLDVSTDEEEYYFYYDGEKFTCTEEGVTNLIGKKVTVNYYSDIYGYNSTMGKKGIWLSTYSIEFANNMTIKLELNCAIFHFNSDKDVTLTMKSTTPKSPVFVNESNEQVESITLSKGNDIWVPFWIQSTVSEEYTLTATIDGVTIKTTTRDFSNGKIYNLGVIEPEVCDFTIVGGHQGWDTANGDAMYKIAGSNTYMRANVTLTDAGFKFYNATTETITVEHPAVTTGEEGDWYLQPNANWKKDGARFAIYFFDDTKGYKDWVSMKDDNGDGIYVANNPDKGLTYEKMIFCRMNPANATNDWSNKWNQTADLVIADAGSNNCYAVKEGTWDNGGGTWKVHTPEIKDAWTEEVEQETQYWFGMGEGFDITNWVDGWTNNYGGDNITVADTAKTYDIYFYHETMQDWGGFGFSYVVLEHGSETPELK